MSNREGMLTKIRDALGRKPGDGPRLGPVESSDMRTVVPPIAREELLARFEAELQAIGGKTHRAASASELEQILLSILNARAASRVVLSKNPIVIEARIREKCLEWGKIAVVWSGSANQEEDGFRRECFAADAGITGVDFALAESGSLVLTSRAEGAQLVSLAPPVHIALYRRDQLCANLEDVLDGLPVSTDPAQPSPARSVVFVTGTSRTADIEQILIRGVHGPREVHAILVEATCLVGQVRGGPPPACN
jgi:L-lactate dehydrogenase complex protein LldG